MRKQIFAEMNIPAPGADTDILAQDFSLVGNEKGSSKAEIVAQLVTESKLHLVARRKAGPTKATGSITVVAGAYLVDGTDDFTLDDGINPALNFEFDDDGSITGDVAVPFDAGMNVSQIAHQVRDAINGAENLEISAALDPEDEAVVLLTHDVGGTDGNQTITESVADAGFTVQNMAGGLDDGEVVMALNGDVALAEGTPYTLELPITSDWDYNLQLDEDSDIEVLEVTVVRGE